MDTYSMKVAPLTTVGIDLEKQLVMIRHGFPLDTPKEEVMSGFLNQAQGFFMALLTMPSNDVLAVAAILRMARVQVPDTENTDPSHPFNRTDILLSELDEWMTIAIMSELSAEERVAEVPPEIFFYRAEETKQIVAIKLSIDRAWHLAGIIEASSPEAIRRMTEDIVFKE